MEEFSKELEKAEDEKLLFLNNALNKLNAERLEILSKKNAKLEEELISLEWIKEIEFNYEEYLDPYGSNEYRLMFYSNLPCFKHTYSSVTIIGGLREYWRNITLFKEEFNDYYSLRTSNVTLFLEFLKTHRPKIKEVPNDFENRVEIYNLLKEIKG